MGEMSRMYRRRRTSRMIVISLLVACIVLLLLAFVRVPPDLPAQEVDSVSLQLPITLVETQRDDQRKTWVEQISWEPRAFVYHNMLTDAECDHLIDLAKPSMRKSTVVDSATGRSKDSRVRTSWGTFLNRGEDEIVMAIEQKIAKFTFIPIERGEGLQVLHYDVGQKYEAHHDYFHDTVNIKNGGQRIATVLMYLSDVEAGGETVFPASEVNASSVPRWNELSECARAGVSVRPRKGDALLFWSMKPDASLDPMSLHGGCPVIKGSKWSATKWLHVHEYKL